MNLYAFELGRQKKLCFAELETLLGKQNLIELNLDTAIFKLNEINPEDLQNQLGGTIKIIKITEVLKNSKIETLKTSLKTNLTKEFENKTGKIPFSISTLSFLNKKEINIKILLMTGKKILKSLNLNSRFINKNFQNTKPSTIFKSKVIEKGIDLNIIKGKSKIYLGKSVSIQNIDNYSKRDFEKPCRDAKIGMLPPKLSQIMINLAGETKTIFDPFCGTGTILMEGLLMNKTVIGSDISEEMKKYSIKNCEWLIENFNLNKNLKYKVFAKDSRLLTKKDLPEKIDAIITEGYLGTPLSQVPSSEKIEKIFRELSNLHLNWLTTIKKLTNCKIVMCTTAIKTPSKIIHLPYFEEIAKTAGYKIENNFTYSRENQIVIRDIKILSPL